MLKRMTSHLIKMNDKAGEPWYFFWSSVSERPAGAAMTWEEVWAWSGRLTGSAGERSVELIVSADRRDTSHPRRESARETIEPCNRAGKGETWLTAEQQLELAIRWRDDPDYEIEGVAQDMVCCMCRKPIASEADRTWVGMPPDPMCGVCRVKVQDAPAGAKLGERGEGSGGLGPALKLLQMLTERHPPREGKAHNLRLEPPRGALALDPRGASALGPKPRLTIEVWLDCVAGFWPLTFSEADLQLPPAEVLAQIEEAIAPGLRMREQLRAPRCDGDHGAPRCNDPQCWRDDEEPWG
jgi:hypothetical protein